MKIRNNEVYLKKLVFFYLRLKIKNEIKIKQNQQNEFAKIKFSYHNQENDEKS